MLNEAELGRYLNRRDAAKYLGVSVRKLDQWVCEGRLPAIRADRRVLVDRMDLDSLYASMKQEAGPMQPRKAK